MNKDRIAYAILMTLATTCAAAAQADAVSAKAAVWLVLVAGGINGFLRLLWPAPGLVKGTGDAP